ncbi:putative phd domain containing protein [Erysiphe necator]|uniref:Putative phd domain containing protein n=1 Tax=Uncinula necator TaxID=52586 RepID=A0A0B1PEE1_UNCNE|nr:putative phd domain containing protein [Erysiphe necator]
MMSTKDKSQTQKIHRNEDSTTITTDSSPKYTPQFSAATQMILERIHSGNSSTFSSMGISGTIAPPPGYEDMRRCVLQTMRTSMNMQIPVTPARDKNIKPKYTRSTSGSGLSITPTSISASNVGKGKTSTKNSRAKTSGKRKRGKDKSDESDEDLNENMLQLSADSEIDDSDALTKLPKITQSGRHIVKPTQFVPATYESYSRRRTPSRKAQEQALCKRCGRGYSPQNNLIVFCDGCNLPWHQNCHKPMIPDDAVQVESAHWFCAECSRKKGIKSGYETTPKGVSWARKSIEEKKAYLSSQSHSQLVALLLQATYLHPDIPLFPWPETRKVQSQPQKTLLFPPSPHSSTVGTLSCFEGNPLSPIKLIRKKQPLPPQPNITFLHASSKSPIAFSQDPQISRESTPASPPYPRPGNGLMAKLGPDDEDIDWLVDTDDYNAFSHSVAENVGDHFSKNNDTSKLAIGLGDVNTSNVDGNLNGISIGD